MKRTLFFFVGPTMLVAQSWVPYTATIIESTEVRDTNGSTNIVRREIEEIRGLDGSTSRVTKIAGQPAHGQMLLACGDLIDVDYTRKTARVVSHSQLPHGHFVPSENDHPAGTEVISGLTATKWPARFSLGTAALWIDMSNDIIVKQQYYQANADGVVVDHTSVIKSIELNPTHSTSTDSLPPGIIMDKTSRQSCASFQE